MKSLFICTLTFLCIGCQTLPDNAFAGVSNSGSLKQVLHDLIEDYETEQAISFAKNVDENFRAVNQLRNSLNSITLKRTLKDDFLLLDNIRFQVFVNAVLISPDKKEARVQIRWDRRAVITKTAELWSLRNQLTELVFIKQPGVAGGWKLLTFLDDTMFAIADVSGKIIISEGEINGKRVVVPIEVKR